MVAQHLGQTATLLQNGQVLIAGGETTKAELSTCPPVRLRPPQHDGLADRHTATLLSDGRVLIAGACRTSGRARANSLGPGASAELYDPARASSPRPAA
jgi:hypothetical protein